MTQTRVHVKESYNKQKTKTKTNSVALCISALVRDHHIHVMTKQSSFIMCAVYVQNVSGVGGSQNCADTEEDD